jgi:hypothetical protein
MAEVDHSRRSRLDLGRNTLAVRLEVRPEVRRKV